MSITKRFNEKKKKEAVNALCALVDKITTGQLLIVDQGFWNGATTDQWIFRLELKENPVPALSEELSNYQQ